MFLKELSLRSFRNWENAEFSFSDGLNVLVGDNAQGKTNCAEAVFFLCTGFSPLAGRDKQMITFQKDESMIFGSASTAFGDVSVEISLFEGRRKQIRVNGTPLKKAGDLLGNIDAVFFNPDELKMVKETPADRRRFLDVAISQLHSPYYYALATYNKILDQRNRLLKEEDEELITETLPVWDRELSAAGAKIAVLRREFIEKLSPAAAQAHAALTGGREELSVLPEKEYLGNEAAVSEWFYQKLRENYERDRRAGFTTSGPHRDDLGLEIDGKDVKTYCSQGQKRTAALSLKLAELEIMREETGEYPLFILDDVFSELDIDRRRRLLDRLSGIQVFLTATHLDGDVFSGRHYRKFTVVDGTYTSTDF